MKLCRQKFIKNKKAQDIVSFYFVIQNFYFQILEYLQKGSQEN